jgi:hypothetical protein
MKAINIVTMVLASTLMLGDVACSAENRNDPRPAATPPSRPTKAVAPMKIRLMVGDETLTATLIDNDTTRDFVSSLPLTMTMNDLFGREKYGRLPRALSDTSEHVFTYEIGLLIYWSPGPDLAVYYRQDGEKIPSPGIVVIGKIDSNVEALNVAGSVKVTMELAEETKAP